MSFTLLGPAYPFSDLFSRQCERLSEAAQEMHALFADLAQATARAKRIRQLESEAHQAYRDVSRELALTFLKPVERGDVKELNLAFDLALKAVAAVAARASLFGLKGVRPAAPVFTANLHEMADQLTAMLERLGRSEDVDDQAAEVERLRQEADRLLLVASGELFEDEAEARRDPLEVFRWSTLYARMEEAADRVERIATVFEAIALKQD
jgi:hypothetical protein